MTNVNKLRIDTLDLLRQATEEKSHHYVASILTRWLQFSENIEGYWKDTALEYAKELNSISIKKGCGKKILNAWDDNDRYYDEICGNEGWLCNECKKSTKEEPLTWEQALPKTMAKAKEAYEKEEKDIHSQNKELLDKDYEIRGDFKIYAKDKQKGSENNE